jgi:hypothetical protein
VIFLKSKVIILHLTFILSTFFGTFCHSQTIEIGGTFFTHQQLKVGEGESSIAVADINSDDHLDLVFTNLEENNVILFQGDGQGNFDSIGLVSAGENPTDIVPADLNSDGNIDLVIANHERSYITLLIGNGLGGFNHASNSPILVNVNPHPHKVSIAFLDGDDKLDLIVDSRDQNGLLILKGLGSANFENPGTLIEVGNKPYLGFITEDVNDDGLVDIVTPNQNEVGLLLNIESEGILFEKQSIASTYPFAVELADINADDKLDLIVVSEGELLEIIPGIGSGKFLTERKSTIKLSAGAKQIAAGDINGDNITDVIISNWSSDLLVVLGGRKIFKTLNFIHKSISNPWGLKVADLNNDGKCDIIVTDGSNDKAVLYISHVE